MLEMPAGRPTNKLTFRLRRMTKILDISIPHRENRFSHTCNVPFNRSDDILLPFDLCCDTFGSEIGFD